VLEGDGGGGGLGSSNLAITKEKEPDLAQKKRHQNKHNSHPSFLPWYIMEVLRDG
jgi:hypothetical protein